MISFINDFHFIRPLWLLALFLPIMFYFKYFKGIKNKSSWENEVDPNLLSFLLVKGSSKNRRFIGHIALSAFILAIISISGPTWNKKEVPNMLPENPVIIALNLSSDMNATDLSPSRLARAKYKISDLLKSLKSVQVGMIVYTDEPFLISPITDDTNILINMLANINPDIMPNNGDRLDRAIEFASKSLQDAGYKNGNLVFFTSDVGQKFDLAINDSRKLKSENYDLSIVNVSTIENEKLEMIAKNGGGIYTMITPNDKDIQLIMDKINDTYSDTLKTSENITMTWEESGYWLSIVVLILSLYFFRKGIFIIVLATSFASSANAGFFLNNNYEGLLLFKKDKFEQAAKTFENKKWIASSYYRLGDYDKAYKEFTKDNDTTALYNQGNSLAKGGKIEEAIAKYEQVLEQDSNFEDARFNLEYLKQQQEQEQQNKQSSDNKDKNEDQQDQNQENGSSEQNQEQNSENQEQKKSETPEQGNDEQSQGQQSQDEKSQEQQNPQQDNTPQYKDKEEENDGDEEQEAMAKQGQEEGDEEWDERIQASEQQYREIPENPGGLLRAFIKKEYIRKRYKD